LSRITRILSKDRLATPEGTSKFAQRIVAVVGTVTNDNRLL
jgi:hypothetical protein